MTRASRPFRRSSPTLSRDGGTFPIRPAVCAPGAHGPTLEGIWSQRENYTGVVVTPHTGEECWIQVVVLRGERVLLRPGRPEDAERLLRIRNEPGVLRWWGYADIDEIREEFIEVEEGFVIEADGSVVGAIQYHEENEPMYRHAGMDIFLTNSRQGEGLGTEAMRLLTRYLFEERGHHRLTIDPAAENAAAIRAYERVGFRAVGIMRRYERGPDDVWRDGLLMDMLEEEFRPTGRRPS